MRSTARDRQILDKRLAAWQSVSPAIPSRGWIRAIREGLGMPLAELGRRLGVTPQAVAQMESSENAGTIRVDTLRRVADALDCTLVYAIVPRSSLEETVDRRATEVAGGLVAHARRTMHLEDQSGGDADEQRLLRELTEQVKRSPRLWFDAPREQ